MATRIPTYIDFDKGEVKEVPVGDTIPSSYVSGGGSGDVVGPASAVDNNIAAFDGVTGKLIKDGGATIASKANVASPTFTGTVTTPAAILSGETASKVAIIDASKNIKSADTATYPSLTELAFLKGVTSALQAQIDAKQASGSYQPLDSDLTTIAGLTATTDNFLVAAASAWASRTPAQAKTSLALVKADVGLGNVDNTSDANKPVSTAQQTALDLKANLASPTFTGTVVLPNSTVTNAMLAGSIAYSKLVLAGAILNADLAGSIAYAKLILTGAILNADLAGSIDAAKINTGVVSNTEFNYLDGVTSAIQTQLDARELLANKATTFDSLTNTLYPSTLAVDTYYVSKQPTLGEVAARLTANISDTILSDTGIVVPDRYEIGSGLSLEIGNTAVLMII